jgi:hypothetical protein
VLPRVNDDLLRTKQMLQICIAQQQRHIGSAESAYALSRHAIRLLALIARDDIRMPPDMIREDALCSEQAW